VFVLLGALVGVGLDTARVKELERSGDEGFPALLERDAVGDLAAESDCEVAVVGT
jgi:hypothetical protein